MAKRIGILTGGGDCPGLNPVIRAVTCYGISKGYEITGILDGWKGLVDNKTKPLTLESVSEILDKGGTILGTSRTNPYKQEKDLQKVKENFKQLGLDALIAIGGEDTLGVASKLANIEKLPVVGVPKTIDNDLDCTDFTFGFDTAVNIAMECLDRLHTTADSHHRVIVAELMGRHAGWITVHAGIAGGADIILVPEIPVDIDEVCGYLKKRHERGKMFSIVAVAEGAKLKDKEFLQASKLDDFGHVILGGIGEQLAKMIQDKTGYETRATVLGHIQRGGSPTAFDRVLGTRFGVKAVELVENKEFGKMTALSGNQIIGVDIKCAVEKLKTVDIDLYNIGKIFFG